jgi:hypothetical protein
MMDAMPIGVHQTKATRRAAWGESSLATPVYEGSAPLAESPSAFPREHEYDADDESIGPVPGRRFILNAKPP